MKMQPKSILYQFIDDVVFGISKIKVSIDFIKEHRLWEGFWKFSWVMRFLLFLGFVAGWKMFSLFRHWFGQVESSNPVTVISSMGAHLGEMASSGYNFFFLSSFKYLILILMEIIIFHFARRTLEIKTGVAQDFTPKTFIAAEVRMIRVVIRNFILETIITVLISTCLSIIGLEFFKYPFFFLVQAYFLGFAIIDNYNELFGMTVKQSAHLTRRYMGLSVLVGILTYSIMLIPIFGAFLAPFLVGVMATLAMHELREREGDWRFDWTTIPTKADKKKKGAVENQTN